jgi:hypothetical protein
VIRKQEPSRLGSVNTAFRGDIEDQDEQKSR